MVTMCCRSAAFVSAVRNMSGGMGQYKAPCCAGQHQLCAKDIMK